MFGLIGSILAILVDVTLYGAFFLVKRRKSTRVLIIGVAIMVSYAFSLFAERHCGYTLRCYLKLNFVMYYALCCIKAVGSPLVVCDCNMLCCLVLYHLLDRHPMHVVFAPDIRGIRLEYSALFFDISLASICTSCHFTGNPKIPPTHIRQQTGPCLGFRCPLFSL